MGVKVAHAMALCLCLLQLHAIILGAGASSSEGEILTRFKNSLQNNSVLSTWNATVGSSPCNNGSSNWIGVRCNEDGTVDKLVLENLGLTGTVRVEILVELPRLRTLSFVNNDLEGPLPLLKTLTSIRNLYLSNNRFSGDIPADAFSGMNSLRELSLAQNLFTGSIPPSLAALAKLQKLSLEWNQFQGTLPNFSQSFTLFNVSNNHLKGRIPSALSNIDSSSFSGNDGLCGKPFPSCKSSNKNTIIIVISVVVGAVVALGVSLALVFILGGRGRGRAQNTTQTKHVQNRNMYTVHGMGVVKGVEPEGDQSAGNTYKVNTATTARADGGGEKYGKLEFVGDGREERFELQDLLRASAEVLGSGTFGSSYKAILSSNGPTMVVKRFKHMNNLAKQEFQEHMRRLGALSHPNLLPLVAFYYRKEEKLLVSDFVEHGFSLATHLHGNRAPERRGLDWPMRLRIIKGVARGLNYLYNEFPYQNLPHGHLKSSNVLLDRTLEPLLTDYALVPIVDREHAHEVMMAYKSPECIQSDHRPTITSRKTDVWSLGILILEMLTGKFPANYLVSQSQMQRQQGKRGNGGGGGGSSNSTDLASWVNSVVREEWTGEVFDKEMKGTKNGEGELLKLLKIGMCCCEWNVDRRWELREAVDKILELRERDSPDLDADDFSSITGSEGDFYSSRITEADFSFSVQG